MIPAKWQRAASALSMLWVATAAGAAATFFAQTLLARRLGPFEYGLFSSSLATVSMIAPLAGFGLSQFRLRAYGAEGWAADRWLRSSFRFSLATTALAVALVVGWAVFGPPVSSETRRVLLVLSPLIVGVLTIDLLGSKLRLEERYRALAAWQIFTPGGRLLVALGIFLLPEANAQWAAAGYCVVALLTVALTSTQLRALLRGDIALFGHGERKESVTTHAGVRQLWAQAWAYGVTAILYPVFFQISTVLLKYLAGNAPAGRYGVALAVMTAIYLLPATIYQKFLLSKLHRWAVHDKEKFWHYHRLGNISMLGAGLVVGAMLAATAPWLVRIGFGERFSGVAAILMVLAICVPIRFLSTAVGSALLTEGQMRYRVFAMGVAAVIAVALNIALIPRYAELGAAYGTIVAELALFLVMYAAVRRMPRPEQKQS